MSLRGQNNFCISGISNQVQYICLHHLSTKVCFPTFSPLSVYDVWNEKKDQRVTTRQTRRTHMLNYTTITVDDVTDHFGNETFPIIRRWTVLTILLPVIWTDCQKEICGTPGLKSKEWTFQIHTHQWGGDPGGGGVLMFGAPSLLHNDDAGMQQHQIK